MKILNIFIIALRALRLNKMRTFLTMLGIIIGVAAVITMLAIGEGSKKSIRDEMSKMGTNMLTIRPAGGQRGGVRLDFGSMQNLTLDDYQLLKDSCKYISAISPQVNGNGQVIYGKNNWPTNIYGVSTEYLDVKIQSVVKGSMFSDREITNNSKVVVIGQTVAKNIFGDEDPIGKIIRFKNIPFTVIGVLSAKGESNFGQDQDDMMIAPYTTVQKRILARTTLQSIIAASVDEKHAPQAQDEIKKLMRKSHKISNPDNDDFSVFSQQEMISTMTSTSEMMTVLLVAIASISLLIGGIGIMNIMYVSVKERTREIGLRMAVGGRGRDILIQFLSEAILISITGGLIGVSLGLGSAWFIEQFANWPISITLYSIVISFSVCTITGVFFGWYPARKAAALDPITALRYE